ncbi:LYST-interacting protein 5-like protein [Zea mays]|nr:LYST-interacting protein 5-like protein [Zea mays]
MGKVLPSAVYTRAVKHHLDLSTWILVGGIAFLLCSQEITSLTKVQSSMIIPLPSYPIHRHHPHSPSILLHHNLIPLPRIRQQQITLLLIFTNHPPIIQLPATQAQISLPMRSTTTFQLFPTSLHKDRSPFQ